MSQQYDNTNSGALFKNEEKIQQGKTNWPDYKGSINVNGQEFWISAWLKKSKAGKNFMSLSVQEKNSQPAQSNTQQSVPDFDNTDDIPF